MAFAEMPAYDMTSGWADLSGVPGIEQAWAHSGLAATAGGQLIGFHAGQLVAFDHGGRVARVVNPGLIEGHGITLVRENDEEYLWVADPGFVWACCADDGDEALAPRFGKGLRRESGEPRVVKMTLGGEIRTELPIPSIDPAYPPGPGGPYRPTSTAVDEELFDGSGDVWVADGYGSGLVHRFDTSGRHITALSGEEGSGRFSCPHAVFIDRRGGKAPELYVADRGNERVQVYDLEGRHLRTFGDGFLNSPSGFVQWGDVLVVAELFARLAVLDPDDDLVGYIGADPGAQEREGWPNALSGTRRVEGAAHLAPSDRFNSPHSVAVDADGSLYVSEWLIGGRYTKLALRP